MPDYAAFFLASRSSVVQLETLEVAHRAFSRTYWIVRNATAGMVATLETGVLQVFQYYPLRLRPLDARDNLDFGIAIDLGDLGEIIPAELDRVAAADSTEKPTVRYRTFRSDDLSQPLFGPVTLQGGPVSMKREGASFEARAPSLALNRTGEAYDLARFPMLRGLL